MAGFESLEAHPLRTGLIWGASFVPLFALITRATQGRWLGQAEWLGLVPAAIVGGVAWAFLYRRILRGEKANARWSANEDAR